MTTALKWISSLTVATAVSLTSLSSGAAEPVADGAPKMTVRAGDLDLTDPGDVQTLYRRVQDAASRLCRDEARRHWRSTRVMAPIGWTERCVADAVNATVRDVADPLLAAMHIRPGIARSN